MAEEKKRLPHLYEFTFKWFGSGHTVSEAFVDALRYAFSSHVEKFVAYRRHDDKEKGWLSSSIDVKAEKDEKSDQAELI